MRKIASKICIFLLGVVLVSAFFPISSSFAEEELYTIQGKIVSSLSGKEITNIPIVLLRFDANIQDAPPVTPIQRSQSNEKGEYIFKGIKKEENIEYLIGALIQGQRVSSKRIQLKNNLQEILNIEYFGTPSLAKEIRYNLKKINYLGNLFVFNLLKNKIRITEVIYLQNESETFISSQKNPLKRKLPKLQKNFQTFEIKDEKLTATLENNFAVLTEVVGQNTTKNQDGKYLLKSIELKNTNTEGLNLIVKTKFANRSIFYFIIAGFFCLGLISLVIFFLRNRVRIKFF